MGADVLGQFIEALLCFGVGAYFGIKIAFTEVIGECSGKVLRFILELILGISYVLCIYVVILWFADGNLKYYHFVIEAIGALLVLPIARKVFKRYKRGIQSVWLWLLGKNIEVDNQEPIAKEKKNKRKKAKKELNTPDEVLFDETLQKSWLKIGRKLSIIHSRIINKSENNDKTAQKSALNRVIREENPNKSLKHVKKQRKSRHTETSNKV